MRYSNVGWTENLALPSGEKISSTSDPGATNIQDLSYDECLLDFLIEKNPNTSILRPFVASITSQPATPFITALLTLITPAITPTLTPPITSSSSTTSSLTAPPSITISFTPPPSIISNRPIARSQFQLNHIPLNIPSTFLVQHTSPISENLLTTSIKTLSLLPSANSVELYKPLTYVDAIRDTSNYKLQWSVAMKEEFDSLIENKTWELSATQSNRTTLGGK